MRRNPDGKFALEEAEVACIMHAVLRSAPAGLPEDELDRQTKIVGDFVLDTLVHRALSKLLLAGELAVSVTAAGELAWSREPGPSVADIRWGRP